MKPEKPLNNRLTTKGKMMTWARAKEIGTHGGCGLLALAVLDRTGGVPMLRYHSDGTAAHAAVKVEGQLVHLGDREDGLQPVSREELARACEQDFDPSFVSLEDGEINAVLDLMFPEEV